MMQFNYETRIGKLNITPKLLETMIRKFVGSEMLSKGDPVPVKYNKLEDKEFKKKLQEYNKELGKFYPNGELPSSQDPSQIEWFIGQNTALIYEGADVSYLFKVPPLPPRSSGLTAEQKSKLTDLVSYIEDLNEFHVRSVESGDKKIGIPTNASEDILLAALIYFEMPAKAVLTDLDPKTDAELINRILKIREIAERGYRLTGHKEYPSKGKRARDLVDSFIRDLERNDPRLAKYNLVKKASDEE